MDMRKFIVKTLSTFFYVGYLPFIPGTFASIAALGVFFIVKDSLPVYLGVVSCLLVLGFLTAGQAEKFFRKKDHRAIVIDEVCGMLLSLLFIPYAPKIAVIAFFLFRLMDTVKPYPADRLQGLKGSIGVMSDDIVAAIYTNIILQAVVRFASFTIS
ncbi:MAG: phosphatidylglycerophosphatase A [Candidatus Omnitrophica bacterium]|nr:phosphatidylglycerophosphatase A [Candidatus Omnitrophota bacterium]